MHTNSPPEDIVTGRSYLRDRPILDSAIIAGHGLADFLSARVTDQDIDPKIISAFQEQYPRLAEHTSFSEQIQNLSSDPEALNGFLMGVKGKYFEIIPVDELNADLASHGLHAELADNPTNPGYDILIKDHDGNIVDLIQAKASNNFSVVYDHFQAHPEIDTVIVPADLAGHAVANVGVVHAEVSNASLNADVFGASDSVLADPTPSLPWGAGVFIALDAANQFRNGVSSDKIAEMVAIRSTGAGAAYAVGKWIGFTIAGPIGYLATSIATRLAWGKVCDRLTDRIHRQQTFHEQTVNTSNAAEQAADVSGTVMRRSLGLYEKHLNSRNDKQENS